MNNRERQAKETLQQARAALKADDKKNAYALAKRAAQLDPSIEDAWLLLAAVSTPERSIKFLQQALRINPGSQRAKKGMAWAERKISPAQKMPPQREQVEKRAPRTDIPEKKKKTRLPLFLVGSFLLICIIGVAFLAFNPSPAMALLGSAPTVTALSTEQHWGEGMIAKPTYTPSPTATFTPTPTFTPTLTFTPTSTFTLTPTPTFTFTPTFTPTITNTPRPTNTRLPTNTPKPAATSIKPPLEIGGGTHWIDVNLSEQRVYAYAGNTLINSFIVSTGIAQTPTITGSYHIYSKHVSTTMAGPGYYLTDVPYTMYFHDGYGLHGTYWHSNFGVPMSHGCVNLRTVDAQWLFNFSYVGTLVRIHY